MGNNSEVEDYKSSLRLYINKIRKGKRILLRDNIESNFVEFLGNSLEGDEMVVEIEGVERKVDIGEFKATLSDRSDIKCPVCSSEFITDGFLKGYSDRLIRFTADVTKNNSTYYDSSDYEDKRVRVNKCIECDYIMLFAEGKSF